MFWIYLYLALCIIFVILVWAVAVETWIAGIRRIAPQVPSSARLRAAVISEIEKNYADKKTVLDIGAYYGGLARKIARRFPNMNVNAIEKMSSPFIISKIVKFFRGPKNLHFNFGDAFEFIEKSDRFDVGVAYLLAPMMGRVEKVAHKFKVLLVLDFPLPNIKPDKTIKLYRGSLGHWHYLYVYENKAKK